MTDTNKDAQVRFGANVDDLRQRRGLSMEALAERAELAQDELTGILSGGVEARTGTVYLLAGALDVDPNDLFNGTSWVPPADGGSGYVIDDSGNGE
jgi:transcriptional regulator with XRE-family HTH domain